MPARRFFVEGVRRIGERIAIDGADARKIVAVLRLRDGDAIELIDSAGTRFTARLEIDGSTVAAVPMTAEPDAAPVELVIDVAQAVPKGQKMDFVVEKLTELGARAILPFTSERSVVHGPSAGKVERWRRLAKAAAAQCGRRAVPAVDALTTFDALLERFGGYDAVLFPWELAASQPLLESLRAILSGARTALIVVGPEGGFSHDEAEAAKTRGAALLSLGSRILRTETAAMALLAIVGALCDNPGTRPTVVVPNAD